MALIQKDGNPDKVLLASDISTRGQLQSLEDTTALVNGCAVKSEAWIASKKYQTLWQESDLLFQAPRPVTTFGDGNTYILEPNVQRFTVAKVCNAIVPQLYKGLFFDNPPMTLRPRPGTHEKVVDEKTAVMSYYLDACQFKREVRWGLEQFVHLGTGIWKWGVRRVEKNIPNRKVDSIKLQDGQINASTIHSDAPPQIEYVKKIRYEPFFEFRPIGNVLVDPALKVSDIREAGYVIDVRYMNYYELRDLKNANVDENGVALPGWKWDEYSSDEVLKRLWDAPVEALETPANLRSDHTNTTVGVVHHGEPDNAETSADPLARKLEILEYVDKQRKIIVVNRRKTIYSKDNEFKRINFFSANWWNRPRAFYGMGIGITVGQNQRVDQGVINSILKILSFGVNPVYLRARDSNSPTQMIRTSIGKIISVDGDAKEAYHLLETPHVPADVWPALSESQANTESTSGADQTLVQGSSAGPRAGMGRNATGAAAMAQASASRLDGPLDGFIEQVFLPWLYTLDELVYTYVSDAEIKDILGEQLGEDYLDSFNRILDPDTKTSSDVNGMQMYHDGKVEFEVLAGAALGARRVMTQSLTLITQFMENPAFNEYLADMGLYIDWEEIFRMYMIASEWKNGGEILKPLTKRMEARRQQKMQMQQQGPIQAQMALQQQKADANMARDEQRSNDRLKGDLTRFAIEHSARSEFTEGTPSDQGFGDLG